MTSKQLVFVAIMLVLALILGGCQGFSTRVNTSSETVASDPIRVVKNITYRYLYSNAVGKVYCIDNGDNWTYLYFEGSDTTYCQRYSGTSSEITLPTTVDGHDVQIVKMDFPLGQIKRIDVPDKYNYITENLIGGVTYLAEGCIIAVHNPEAEFELPLGSAETMKLCFAGYSGSTTEKYALTHGFQFITLR